MGCGRRIGAGSGRRFGVSLSRCSAINVLRWPKTGPSSYSIGKTLGRWTQRWSLANSISVAMATYNGKRFIAEQLESLFNQTALPDEIVISDDCSSDGTREIIEDFARRSPVPIRLHVNERTLGWRANFMRAASLCSGDLISFCDQDDIWETGKFARVVPAFADPDVVMVFHGFGVIDESGQSKVPAVTGDGEGRMFSALEMDHWAMMLGFTMTFRRDLLKFSEYWYMSLDRDKATDESDVPAAHDQWILFLASVMGKIVYLNDPLVRYRLHGKNSMGLRTSRHQFREIVASFRFSGKKLAHRIRVTDRYRQILRVMSEERVEIQDRIFRAEPIYDAHLQILRKRFEIYSAGNALKRMSAFANLLSSGAYGSCKLPLSKWEVRKDAVACALGNRFMIGLADDRSASA